MEATNLEQTQEQNKKRLIKLNLNSVPPSVYKGK